MAVLLAVAAACTGDDDGGPSPTTEATSSTTVVDYSGVALRGVDGETTTTIQETGTARLVGTVTGPTGPVAGASVRVDRIVAGREVRRDVRTAADGTWELRGVPGGRYRVRAFQAPAYAQTVAEVRFLADGEEHRFDLVVEDQSGIVVRADAAPDQPLVGAPVNVVVVVAHRTVDGDGVVRAQPAAGVVVELTGLGRWVRQDDVANGGEDADDGTITTFGLEPATTTTTTLSGAGWGRFELHCRAAGSPDLVLRVPVEVVPAPGTGSSEPFTTVEEVALDLPACNPSGAATTSTTAP
jgi:hypothetical protein